jgi:hypothetical protein
MRLKPKARTIKATSHHAEHGDGPDHKKGGSYWGQGAMGMVAEIAGVDGGLHRPKASRLLGSWQRKKERSGGKEENRSE